MEKYNNHHQVQMFPLRSCLIHRPVVQNSHCPNHNHLRPQCRDNQSHSTSHLQGRVVLRIKNFDVYFLSGHTVNEMNNTGNTAVVWVIKPWPSSRMDIVAVVWAADVEREAFIVVIAISIHWSTRRGRRAAVIVFTLAASVCWWSYLGIKLWSQIFHCLPDKRILP